jgi:hypothetical protein
VLDGEIGEGLSGFEIVLQEVEEGDVVRSHSHHNFIFLFESLEALDGSLNLFVLDVVDSLADFHLGFDFGKRGSLKCFADVFITSDDIVFNERSNELGSTRNVLEGFLLLFLEPYLERVVLGDLAFVLLLKFKKFLLLFFFDSGNINKKESFEPGAHLLTLAERVEADNEVEANVEIRLVVHDVLVDLDTLTESLLFD